MNTLGSKRNYLSYVKLQPIEFLSVSANLCYTFISQYQSAQWVFPFESRATMVKKGRCEGKKIIAHNIYNNHSLVGKDSYCRPVC